MNAPALQASARIIVSLIIISFFPFLFAGTFNFWQAWVFLALFSTAQTLIIRYLSKYDPDLLQRRLRGGVLMEKRITQKILIFFMQTSFFSVLIVSGFAHARAWAPAPAFLTIAADLGVLLGLWIQWLAFKANTFASIVVAVIPTQRVVSSGVYAAVRHPMYSGLLLSNFFIPLALGSWCGMPLFLLMLAVVILRLLDEEKLLRQSLPGYEKYRQNVKYRIIPGIW
jgi:protein-S-isoprenylcysteine O-methyltransferase Ste14